jgi:radical SAM enzyme (TIGR01210 family)
VSATAVYPAGRAARDRFVLARRGPRVAVDPWAAPRVVVDPEPEGRGGVVDVATLFLTGRECPWRCVMCDLWRHTIEGDTPPGAIPHQIRLGLARGSARHLKLYNAGSFFDPKAVPPADDPAIAAAVAGMERVTVEAHPRLIGDRTWRFRDLLARARGEGQPAGRSGPALEVAIGLETAHPDAFARLNKGCTVDEVAAAGAALAAHGVGLRVFLLVHPPFVPLAERTSWLRRSIDVALDAGASLIALIPTRGDPPDVEGAGVMAALAAQGDFVPPSLGDLEDAATEAVRHAAGRARIIADLWDLAAFARCAACLEARRARLLRLNLEQRAPTAADGGGGVSCAACGWTPGAT